jgi:hypothetical protein
VIFSSCEFLRIDPSYVGITTVVEVATRDHSLYEILFVCPPMAVAERSVCDFGPSEVEVLNPVIIALSCCITARSLEFYNILISGRGEGSSVKVSLRKRN